VAEAPITEIVFAVALPTLAAGSRTACRAAAEVGDDFDWLTRDYDGFRLFMMEELSARIPSALGGPLDFEVVLVEVLAAVLDQLSDRLDRVAAEAYLETARRPESVRRLLQYIGYDACAPRWPPAKSSPIRQGQRGHAGRRVARQSAHDGGRARGWRARDPRPVPHGHRRRSWAATRAPPSGPPRRRVAEWGGAWSVVRVGVLPVVDRPIDERWSADDRTALQATIDAFHLEATCRRRCGTRTPRPARC